MQYAERMEAAVLVINKSFKQAQKSIFQDKIIEIYPEEKSSGSLGTPQSKPASAPSWCGKVNFRIITNALQAEQYGLRLGKDASVTCSDIIPAEIGGYVQYSGDYYRITEIISHDAYIKLICRRI